MLDIEDIKRIAEVEFSDIVKTTTFPHHFHNGSQDIVEASPFPVAILERFRAFMNFVRNKLTTAE